MRTGSYHRLLQRAELSSNDLDAVFDAAARYFLALAEPTRLRILHTVCHGELSVNEIVAATGLSQSNASRHLGLMHRMGILRRRRDGSQVFYSVADESVTELCRAVCVRMMFRPALSKTSDAFAATRRVRRA